MTPWESEVRTQAGADERERVGNVRLGLLITVAASAAGAAIAIALAWGRP